MLGRRPGGGANATSTADADRALMREYDNASYPSDEDFDVHNVDPHRQQQHQQEQQAQRDAKAIERERRRRMAAAAAANGGGEDENDLSARLVNDPPPEVSTQIQSAIGVMAEYGYLLHQPRPDPPTLPPSKDKTIEETIFDLVEMTHYSDKYEAGEYEYRHVQLAKALLPFIPKRWHNRLLEEWQCRAIGITQSPGWVHYELHKPEPHIFLFRRKKPLAPPAPPPDAAGAADEGTTVA